LIAPVGGLGLLFWAIRDGFIRQAVTLGSKSDAITYRGSNHMTATFAASLDPYLREELPEIE